jgi:PGF-CTERM protein
LTTGQTVVSSVDMTALTDFATNAGVGATASTWTYDVTAPTLSSAARVNNTHITVTMSEAVKTLGDADGGFIVAKNGDPETTYVVSGIVLGGSANLVVLTVADISGSIATGVKVTYNASADNGTITDLAGNNLTTDDTGVIVAAWQTSSGGSSGGDGTYPPGWFETPTPTVTATKAPTPSATATATDAPPGDKVTPAPTKKPEAAKTTTPAAEGTTAETPKSTPGFTAVFVIAGLLAVAYAMMRRRE